MAVVTLGALGAGLTACATVPVRPAPAAPPITTATAGPTTSPAAPVDLPTAGLEPTPLASGERGVVALAVGGARTCWIRQGGGSDELRCVVGGEISPRIVTRGDLHGLAMADGLLAWSTGESVEIERPGQDRAVLRTLGVPSGLAATADTLYVVTHGGNPDTEQPTGELIAWNRRDGISRVMVGTLTANHSLVADARGAYWIEYTHQGYDEAAVRAAEPRSATAFTLVSAARGIRAVAVGGEEVFWANAQAGTLEAVDRDGTGRRVVARGLGDVTELAVDDAYVYWVAPKAGVVGRVPRAGGAPEAIASGQASPRALAVGGGQVVWAEGEGETIWRVPAAVATK